MDHKGMRRSRRRLIGLVGRVLVAALAVGGPGGFAALSAGAGPAAAETTANSPGYWLAATDGGVYSFDAPWLGALRGTPLNRPVVGAAAAPDGGGYWLVASDGGIFSYGDARFFGSTGNIRLNQPIVGMASTPDGGGYWLVASDGGIFAFGDAAFHGSTGNIHLNQPIVGMASTPDGGGYWLVARDGGIFAFGDARFQGSTGGIHLNRPIVGMAATADGGGYWLAASDGGIFTFGDAPFLGSAGSSSSPAPFSVLVATPHGVPGATHGDGLPLPGTTGYDVSQWQCGRLPAARSFAVVQVSAGAIDSGPNPCYRQEAAWAGENMSAYVFGDGLPSPAPSESLTGPAGTCRGDVACEGYNFGWYWARHWVAYSAAAGVSPAFWWFDVETGYWSSDLAANAAVIRGAIDGFRSTGAAAGVYSTAYQWPQIAGSLSIPGLPLWVAGADYVTGDSYAATSFCAGGRFAFAGGRVSLVQYGYTGAAAAPYDPDYACP